MAGLPGHQRLDGLIQHQTEPLQKRRRAAAFPQLAFHFRSRFLQRCKAQGAGQSLDGMGVAKGFFVVSFRHFAPDEIRPVAVGVPEPLQIPLVQVFPAAQIPQCPVPFRQKIRLPGGKGSGDLLVKCFRPAGLQQLSAEADIVLLPHIPVYQCG